MNIGKRIAFTLAMGVMVGSLSVVINLGSSGTQPAEAKQMSGLKEMYNKLSDDQKEKLMNAVKNQEISISDDDLSKLADINPANFLTGF